MYHWKKKDDEEEEIDVYLVCGSNAGRPAVSSIYQLRIGFLSVKKEFRINVIEDESIDEFYSLSVQDDFRHAKLNCSQVGSDVYLFASGIRSDEVSKRISATHPHSMRGPFIFNLESKILTTCEPMNHKKSLNNLLEPKIRPSIMHHGDSGKFYILSRRPVDRSVPVLSFESYDPSTGIVETLGPLTNIMRHGDSVTVCGFAVVGGFLLVCVTSKIRYVSFCLETKIWKRVKLIEGTLYPELYGEACVVPAYDGGDIIYGCSPMGCPVAIPCWAASASDPHHDLDLGTPRLFFNLRDPKEYLDAPTLSQSGAIARIRDDLLCFAFSFSVLKSRDKQLVHIKLLRVVQGLVPDLRLLASSTCCLRLGFDADLSISRCCTMGSFERSTSRISRWFAQLSSEEDHAAEIVERLASTVM